MLAKKYVITFFFIKIIPCVNLSKYMRDKLQLLRVDDRSSFLTKNILIYTFFGK